MGSDSRLGLLPLHVMLRIHTGEGATIILANEEEYT